MNGNNPYAGRPGVVEAGKRTADAPSITAEQRRSLRDSVVRIEALTRTYLPDEYIVGSEISQGANGARATVAVRPPVGAPVSAGFEPDLDDEVLVAAEDREEVARGLAASAALQVKHALADEGGFTPAAR